MNLEQIEARLKAATLGDWHAETGGHFGARVHSSRPKRTADGTQRLPSNGAFDLVRCGECDLPKAQKAANARFIAHAHQDVPALIARVRELEEKLELAARAFDGSNPEAASLLFVNISRGGFSDEQLERFVRHLCPALFEATRWRDVREELPAKYEEVRALCDNGRTYRAEVDDEGNWQIYSGNSLCFGLRVEEWCPLPEPRKETP